MNSTPTASASGVKPFCSHCGHEVGHEPSHSRSFWEEAVELGFHFDFRHLRSLPKLLIPGALAKLHKGSQRGLYSPPLKIYVFICLLYFAMSFAHTAVNAVVEQVQAGANQVEEHALTDEDGQAFGLIRDGSNAVVKLGDLGDWLGINGRKLKLDGEHLPGNLRRSFFMGLFLIFPLLSLLLKLIYRRQSLSFWDHMAFVLYAQSSVFLLLLYSEAVDYFGWRRLHWDLTTIAIVSAIFLCLSQKSYYGQGWGKTLLKFGILVNAYLISLSIMIVLSFCVGFVLSFHAA